MLALVTRPRPDDADNATQKDAAPSRGSLEPSRGPTELSEGPAKLSEGPTKPSDASVSPTAPLGRRRFVRLGVGGAALLGLGGLLAHETSGYELAADEAAALYALSPKELLIVRALAARLLRPDEPAPGEAPFPDPTELRVAEAVDELVARLDDANRSDLKRLLHAVEHAVPLTAGFTSRFTRLEGDDQDAVLAAMETSSIGLLRGAFQTLKGLCAMPYYASALAWAPLGYDGPLVGRPAEGWVAAARLTRERATR